jgi:hypothetical protein
MGSQLFAAALSLLLGLALSFHSVANVPTATTFMFLNVGLTALAAASLLVARGLKKAVAAL